MGVRALRLGVVVAVIHIAAALAYAQGGRSSLSGVVRDADGGVLPGVTVVITDPTGTKTQTLTNGSGVFSVPSISAGTYAVTLTLEGFKTMVLDKVVVVAAAPSNLTITMAIGGLEETIQVSAASELVQTQATTVTTTLDTDKLQTLPMVTRNVMQSLPVLLVGVDQTAGDRSATINGLPQNAVKLTIDGIDVKPVQGNGDTSGFYAYVYPAADAMEAVTVSSGQGADSSGDGAASVRFVTKGGTDRFAGSFFEYFRHNSLNTTYYFNTLRGLPKDVMTVHNFGATLGGPIIRQKAFFFFDAETFINPTSITPTRQMLTPLAQRGIFTYNTANGPQQVDLLKIAADNGQLSAVNPVIGPLLAQIRAGAESQGIILPNTEPNTQNYTFQFIGTDRVPQPSYRVDVNLGKNNRFTNSYHGVRINWEVGSANPPRFPGLPNVSKYVSTRTTGSSSLRTILGTNLVNVATFGFQNQDTRNLPAITKAQFENQGGFNLSFPTIGGIALTSATSSTGRQYRHAPLRSFEDQFTWQRGAHSLSFGGSFSRYKLDPHSDPIVPGLQFGVQAAVDPADAMFNATNFPGAATADLTSARALYGFLTGRVTAITANAALDADGKNYVYLGRAKDDIHMSEWGLFVQDQWRLTSGLTLNAGLRYQIQLGATPGIASYSKADVAALCGVSGTGDRSRETTAPCNVAMPGTLTGTVPQYTQFLPGTSMFDADRNNFAPNVGVAWRPDVETGFWRKVLGDPSQATVRANFAMSFTHETLGAYEDVFTANPGRSFSAARNAANGNLVLAGESWPVLMTQTGRLGPPAACSGTISAACYPATPTFPIAATTANNMSVFDPGLHAGYTRQYTVGLQRPLSSDMVVEIRYLRTDSYDGVGSYNQNEIMVKENGFLDEFKVAQQNLYANVAAGRGQTFAYAGPGTGTSPLPIFLAHFNGVPAAQSGDASRYSGANWTSANFTAFLNRLNPNPLGFATTGGNGLYGNATLRANGRAAGLPVNFWLLNPNVGQANFTTNAETQKYNSLQIELRKRMSHGLVMTASYALSKTLAGDFSTIYQPMELVPSTSGVPQSAKFAASWDLPFGHGRAHGGGSPGWLNAIAGDWNIATVARAQSGVLARLAGARLVGMTEKELQKVYKIRIDEAKKVVYILPQDIIENTIKAYSSNVLGYTLGAPSGRYIAPASNGNCVEVYRGDCGEPRYLNLRGPIVARMDLTFRKMIPLGGGKRIDLQYDVFNVFNAIQFDPVLQASASANINQVTSAYTNGNTYDPGGRLGQIVIKFLW